MPATDCRPQVRYWKNTGISEFERLTAELKTDEVARTPGSREKESGGIMCRERIGRQAPMQDLLLPQVARRKPPRGPSLTAVTLRRLLLQPLPCCCGW